MDIDFVELGSMLAVLLFSLSIHETAHAWTADRLGDPTARNLGRVSLNPLVHADPFGTFLFPLIGYFTGFFVGWAKPVPVNVAALRNPRRDHTLVAAAGPLSNVAIALVLFVLLFGLKTVSQPMELMVNQAIRGFGSPDGAAAILVPILSMAYFGVWINVLLAIFNLIPVAPLDGAAVVSGLLPATLARSFDALQTYGILVLVALIYYGIPGYVFFPVVNAIESLLVL